MNFYLIYGTDSSLIRKKEEEIIKKININKNNIIKYSSNETYLEDIIEDASMISLFQDKKLIIIQDANYFSGAKNDIPNNSELLLSYMNNYNTNTYIIFSLISDKIDSRLKITKKITEIGLIYEIKKYESNYISNFIKEYLNDKGYSINSIDLNYFANRVYHDTNNIINELNKLILYKDDNKIIVQGDIDDIVSLNVENDIFILIENITKKNISRSLDLYHELLHKNEEPIKIIALLESQYRLIYQVQKMSTKNIFEKEMASILNVHPYRVKLALELSYQYTTNELEKYIKALSTLDQNIKMGNIFNGEIGLELFILKIEK